MKNMLDLQETYFASSDPNLFIFYYPLPISLGRGGKIQSNMAEILSVVKANTTLNMQLNEKNHLLYKNIWTFFEWRGG